MSERVRFLVILLSPLLFCAPIVADRARNRHEVETLKVRPVREREVWSALHITGSASPADTRDCLADKKFCHAPFQTSDVGFLRKAFVEHKEVT